MKMIRRSCEIPIFSQRARLIAFDSGQPRKRILAGNVRPRSNFPPVLTRFALSGQKSENWVMLHFIATQNQVDWRRQHLRCSLEEI